MTAIEWKIALFVLAFASALLLSAPFQWAKWAGTALFVGAILFFLIGVIDLWSLPFKRKKRNKSNKDS